MVKTRIRNLLLLLSLLQACSVKPLSPAPIPTGSPRSVIHFWASWCPICIHELQVMQLQAAYFKEHDIKVTLVAIDDEPAAVASILNHLGITFTSKIDRDGSSKASYGIRQLPTTTFIGAHKVWEISGPVSWGSPEVQAQLLTELQ